MNQGESVSRRGRVHSSLFPDFISVCECLIINSCSWRRRLLLHGHVCRGENSSYAEDPSKGNEERKKCHPATRELLRFYYQNSSLIPNAISTLDIYNERAEECLLSVPIAPISREQGNWRLLSKEPRIDRD